MSPHPFCRLAAIVFGLVAGPFAAHAEPHLGEAYETHVDLAGQHGLPACAPHDRRCLIFVGVVDENRAYPRGAEPVETVDLTALHAVLAPGVSLEQELRCLALAAYGEARGEGIDGMRAVLAVVQNRMTSPHFPATACAVVVQKHQFEPFSNARFAAARAAIEAERLPDFPEPSDIIDARAQHLARLLVWQLTHHLFVEDPTAGATFFFAPAVLARRGDQPPAWARDLERTARIGGHVFFREPGRQIELASFAPTR